MPRRLAELVPVAEHAFDEPRRAPVAVMTFRPVEHSEHRRNRKRVDPAAFGNESRVVFVGEFTDRVVIGKRLRERDRQQMVARVLGQLYERVDRFIDLPHERGNLAGLELLHRGRVVEEQLLDLDTEALEDDAAGEARAGAFGPETDLL